MKNRTRRELDSERNLEKQCWDGLKRFNMGGAVPVGTGKNCGTSEFLRGTVWLVLDGCAGVRSR